MTNLAQHTAPPHPNFRNRGGVMAALIVGAACWTCVCLVLAWTLTSCAVAPVTVSPARIVCISGGVTVWDYTVDAATLNNGAITDITIGNDTAPFDAPEGAACSIQ